MTSFITKATLYKAVCKNKWLAVRWGDNSVFGVNCAIMRRLHKHCEGDQTKTNVIGFYPISFHEYIRIKIDYGLHN